MSRRIPSGPVPPGATVASTVQRLAVLLDAGIAPLAAWRAVAAASGCPPAVIEAVRRAASAHELPAALRAAARRDAAIDDWTTVAAAWEVADEAGAPLAATLDRLARVLRDLDGTAREIATALAGPIATARIVLLLPLAGIGVGYLVGADPIAMLVGGPVGWCCLGAGALFLGGAAAVTRRLLAVARRHDRTPGLRWDLLAVALAGGMDVPRARAVVDRALHPESASPPRDPVADAVLEFAVASGAPAGALFRAEAEEARRIAAADGARRAAVLGVRLMLPLGLGVLPAFVALGVAPVLFSLASASLGAL